MNRLKSFCQIVGILLVFQFVLNAETTVIPFRLLNNLIIIEANIESRKGNLILDTGSDGFFLDRFSASGKNDSELFKTLNGEYSSSVFKVKSLTIGGISKRNLDAYGANLSNLEQFLSIDIAGIIGTKLFYPNSIFIDFQTNEIFIYTKAPDLNQFVVKNQIDFFMLENVPVVKVKIENSVYDFFLDSGASIHIVDQTLIGIHENIFHKLSAVVSLESLGSTESVSLSKFEIGEWMVGNTVLTNKTCLSKDFSIINQGQTNPVFGIISVAGISNKGILIDFHRMKIWF